MECPLRMVGQPRQNIGMFMGCVIVGDCVNDFSDRDGSLDGVEESNELLMPMLLHAAPDDGSIEDVERREKRGRAVAFVIVHHGPAFSGFQRLSPLGAIKRLNLAFLIDGYDDRVSGRRHVEADDVFDLLGESGIAGALEGTEAIGLSWEPPGSPRSLPRSAPPNYPEVSGIGQHIQRF